MGGPRLATTWAAPRRERLSMGVIFAVEWTLPRLGVVGLGAALMACGSDSSETVAETLARTLTVTSEDSVVTLASGDTVHVSAATIEFYRTRGWQPAWSEGRGLDERGELVYIAVGKAADDGLSPERYRHDVANRMLTALDEGRLSDEEAAGYAAGLDVLLTEGFNRLTSDLVTGTLDPQDNGLEWRIPVDAPKEQTALASILNGHHPETVLAGARPSIPYYDRMREALAKYQAVEARGGWPLVPEGEDLEPGVRSPAVAVLRTRFLHGADEVEAGLARLGAADSELYDEGLKQAVERFQYRHAIENDGAVGEATLQELNRSVADRLADLRLNLDRWRWLPNELGDRFVLVNIAGYELELVDAGRAIQSMNVVVGKLENATPVFADTIEQIVVNPSWYVPPSIAEGEILPTLAGDPGYLSRNNMVMEGDGIRQRPGPNNALGRFKFVFPNEDNIFLHDTPQDHLFSRTQRDFSHGCIRLELPHELAKQVLDLQTDEGSAQIEPLLEDWQETPIELDRTLPIYILYLTAWVEEDGTVRFHPDVYGSDQELEPQAAERLPPEA
ncbi:MAG: L,D-transpeptidase family protein [Gemmatimonas sp.]|nr:L,D-transpeptidase family protein [Gemmatimonas sp.]